MKVVYPAIFHKEDNVYWVEFPDLEGCQSYGDTEQETLDNASEALAAYCATFLDQGKTLPKPSNALDIKYGKDSFVSLVSANVSLKTKSVKKTLTIPGWLNDRAVKNSVNFSQVLQEALLEKLGR